METLIFITSRYDILYTYNTFPIRIYLVNVTKTAVSFTEEILNEKLHILCSVRGIHVLLKPWEIIVKEFF